MPGSVGAVAQLIVHNESSKKILVTPNNIDINTFSTNDLFVLRDLYGSQEIQSPIKGNFSISKWAPVLFALLSRTDSKCSAFISTKNSCLAGARAIQMWKEKGDSHPNLLRLSHCGLLQDLNIEETNVGIPIVDCSTEEALNQVNNIFEIHGKKFPAIIVRNYGLLSWGPSLGDLRNKFEILDRLFEIQL